MPFLHQACVCAFMMIKVVHCHSRIFTKAREELKKEVTYNLVGSFEMCLMLGQIKKILLVYGGALQCMLLENLS